MFDKLPIEDGLGEGCGEDQPEDNKTDITWGVGDALPGGPEEAVLDWCKETGAVEVVQVGASETQVQVGRCVVGRSGENQ